MNEIPSLTVLFQRFGLALALGLLIGVEREREKGSTFAGIRTFPLIALTGCAAALLNQFFVPWIFPVTFAIVAAFVLGAYFFTRSSETAGITTEVAALLAFLFGGLVWWRLPELAAALTVVTTFLLAMKRPLQRVSRQIDPKDIIAALEFGVVTLIILPILPNRTFGPLDVLNPRRIWLMVVLIAGVNLVSYALIKIFGSKQGIGLTGFLGGLGSSTAVALSFSRRSRSDDHLAPALGLGITLASTIMFARIVVLAMSVKPSLGRALLIPVVAASVVGFLGCAVIWFIDRKRSSGTDEKGHMEASNPFELWPAIQFGLLFTVILFVSKAAQQFIGTGGLYLSSVLAGMADVDAITLSLSNLVGSHVSEQVAARGIMFAGLSNTLVKGLIVLSLGTRRLARWVAPLFAAILVAGSLALLSV